MLLQLLALVGETLSDEPEEIHGVVCQNRGHRGLKLQVWNRTASKAQQIRRKLEDVIGLSSKPYAAFSKKN